MKYGVHGVGKGTREPKEVLMAPLGLERSSPEISVERWGEGRRLASWEIVEDKGASSSKYALLSLHFMCSLTGQSGEIACEMKR